MKYLTRRTSLPVWLYFSSSTRPSGHQDAEAAGAEAQGVADVHVLGGVFGVGGVGDVAGSKPGPVSLILITTLVGLDAVGDVDQQVALLRWPHSIAFMPISRMAVVSWRTTRCGQAGVEEQRREHVVELFEEAGVALELEVDLALRRRTGGARRARPRARSIAALSCSTVNGLVTYSLAPTASPFTRSSWWRGR